MIDYRICALIILPAYQAREHKPYDYFKVKENFDKVLDTLGDFDKRDLIVNIDLKMKGSTSWDTADKVCSVLRTKISQYFLRRESKYRKLPFARSIEEKVNLKGYIENHAHIMIRMKDLKQYYDEYQIKDIIENICYSMDEVNTKKRRDGKPPVNVCTIPFWKNEYNKLGKRIVYICKTSSIHYDPLSKGLFPN